MEDSKTLGFAPSSTIRIKKVAIYVALGVAATCALGLYYFFLISRTDWRIVDAELTGQTYANQWAHILQGRWDIDPQVNTIELHLVDGKYYVYFGIFPAVVRGLLAAFWDLSVPILRIELLLAALVFAWASFMIGVQLKLHEGKTAKYFWMTLAILFLGSPVIYILTPAHCYHIAIMWGMAMMSWFNYFFLRFAMTPKGKHFSHLLILGVLAACTMLSRPNTGVGAFFVLGVIGIMLLIRYLTKNGSKLLDRLPLFSMKQLVTLALVWFFCGSTYLYVNYKRFGDPFSGDPVTKHLQFMNKDGTLNERGQNALKHPMLHWTQLVPRFEYYFIPHADNFSSHWPFLILGNTSQTAFFADYTDYVEPATYIPLTLTAPLFLILSLLALLRWRDRFESFKTSDRHLFAILVLGNLCPCLFLMLMWSSNLRYSADFLPLLVLSSFLGPYWLKSNRVPILENKRFPILFWVLGVYSVFAVHATYLVYAVTNFEIEPGSRVMLYQKFIAPFMPKQPGPGS